MRIRHAKTPGKTIPGKEKSKGKDAWVEMRWIYWGAEKGQCIFGVVSEGVHYYIKRGRQDRSCGRLHTE